VRTLVPLLATALLCACASSEGSSPAPSRVETLKTGVKQGGEKVATATVRGAVVVGDSVGTAYRGVTSGFEEPEGASAYGPYPRDYVNTIRKHMMRFQGVKDTASFQFGKPVRAYLNKGLLRGGDIDWQGWVVDVTIETKTVFGQPDVDECVVRMKDGDVVEVLEKAYAGALRRVSEETPPAPAAPRR
jgi:hypothetical protein